jgi:cold shock CspA family protein
MREELGTDLVKTKRIRELLTILQWPGITPDEDGKPTRYMEIEHRVLPSVNKRGKVNEYRDRPVLPLPSKMLGYWSRQSKAIRRDLVATEETIWTGMIVDAGLGPNQSYGYIQPDNSTEAKLFFHLNNVVDQEKAKSGQKVSYRKNKSLEGRWQAVDIQAIDD